MIKFFAILCSIVVMVALVYDFGLIVLVGLPLIVLAILFGEMHDVLDEARFTPVSGGSETATDY